MIELQNFSSAALRINFFDPHSSDLRASPKLQSSRPASTLRHARGMLDCAQYIPQKSVHLPPPLRKENELEIEPKGTEECAGTIEPPWSRSSLGSSSQISGILREQDIATKFCSLRTRIGLTYTLCVKRGSSVTSDIVECFHCLFFVPSTNLLISRKFLRVPFSEWVKLLNLTMITISQFVAFGLFRASRQL